MDWTIPVVLFLMVMTAYLGGVYHGWKAATELVRRRSEGR